GLVGEVAGEADGSTLLAHGVAPGNACEACPLRTDVRRRPRGPALEARRPQGCRPVRTGPRHPSAGGLFREAVMLVSMLCWGWQGARRAAVRWDVNKPPSGKGLARNNATMPRPSAMSAR